MRDLIISDGRFTTQLAQECPGLECHIRSPGQEMNPAIAHVLEASGPEHVAIEATSVTVADYEALRAAAPTVTLCRRRRAGRGAAADQGRRRDRGDSRGDADCGTSLHDAPRGAPAGRERKGRRRRARGLPAAVRRDRGEFSADRGRGRSIGLAARAPDVDTLIGHDDFVLVDWGATGRPYKSDLTRVLVTGKVTPKFEAIYRIVLTAQERGIAAIRPGVKAHDVDAEARSVIEEAGFGRFFDHGLGHGLGMDIHEAPRLRKASDVTLEPGMVVTVEPGIYLPDWGGIRIEDDVLVTPDGCEVLTHVAQVARIGANRIIEARGRPRRLPRESSRSSPRSSRW